MKVIAKSVDQIVVGPGGDLEPGSVQAIVTSPPYWGRRVYGTDEAELGGEDLIEYVRRLTLMLGAVRPALAADGVAWVNIGDTAAGSGGAGGDHNSGGSKAATPKYRQATPVSLLPMHAGGLFPEWAVGLARLEPMNWCLVPSLLALHLQGDGWLVRSWITWDKGQRRPEALDHVRRPGEASEVILMLARRRGYRFHADRLAEPGDVWHFRPGASPGSAGHFAPFPDELAERCILPSTEPGDLVLDPFSGSGTTLRVAERLGRRAVGIDLYAPGAEAAS